MNWHECLLTGCAISPVSTSSTRSFLRKNSNEVEWQGWGTALFVLVERLASRRSGEVPGHGVSQLSPSEGD
jgi:hypothetical protein